MVSSITALGDNVSIAMSHANFQISCNGASLQRSRKWEKIKTMKPWGGQELHEEKWNLVETEHEAKNALGWSWGALVGTLVLVMASGLHQTPAWWDLCCCGRCFGECSITVGTKDKGERRNLLLMLCCQYQKALLMKWEFVQKMPLCYLRHLPNFMKLCDRKSAFIDNRNIGIVENKLILGRRDRKQPSLLCRIRSKSLPNLRAKVGFYLSLGDFPSII